MIEKKLGKRIYEALGRKEILTQKGKYYITTDGKKEEVTRKQIEQVYTLIMNYLDAQVELFQRNQIEEGKIGQEFRDCMIFMQPLGDDFIHKDDSKVATRYVKSLADSVKKWKKEDDVKRELQKMILEEKDFRISILMDLYHTGLIQSLECYLMLNAMYMQNKISAPEVIKCVEKNGLPLTIIGEIVEAEKLVELYNKNKSIKYINYLPVNEMIDYYDTEKLSKQELARTTFNRSSMLPLLDSRENTKKVLDFLSKDIPNRMVPTAGDFMDLLKARKITEEECQQFLLLDKVKKDDTLSDKIIACHQNGFFNNREMFEMVKLSWVEEDILLELHEMQQIMKSAVLFPDAFAEEHITDEELRGYFNAEKLQERRKQNKLTEEFFEFYREILPKEEEELQEFEHKMVEDVKKQEDSLENMLTLWKEGILSLEAIQEEISEEEVIEKAENIERKVLWNLYNHNILSIEGLAMIFDHNLDEIARSLPRK